MQATSRVKNMLFGPNLIWTEHSLEANRARLREEQLQKILSCNTTNNVLSELHSPDTSSNKKNSLADILNKNAGDRAKRLTKQAKSESQ